MPVSTDLRKCIAAFARCRVLVIGEAMLDSYLHGEATRLCREAPVPVVGVDRTVDEPGGAANTAVNVHSLSGQVTFLSVIGDDEEGDRLRQALHERGISSEHLLIGSSRRTVAKHRIVAGTQLLLRFDQGSTEPLDPRAERSLRSRLVDLFTRCEAVIVSDYGYGIMTPRIIETLARLQAKDPRTLVVDARTPTAYRAVGVTAVKPNYEETAQLLGRHQAAGTQDRAGWISACGEQLLEATGARIVAATLDTEGAIVFERNSPPYRTYTRPASNAFATGAGDTFVSALTLALATGAHTPAAAELASAAAGVVVAKDGTASCSARELRECFGATDKYMSSLTRLVDRVRFHRQQGRRIVFTNGCFDILHRGHITFLNRAKALGDVLIVGLNSDAGIARLKGPERPINSLDDRAEVLAALSCVDHLIAFDEDTPIDLIRVIKPDVFVKGGDYTRETLPEAPVVEALGGSVHILPYLESFSTTGIIRRIHQVAKGRADASDAAIGGKPEHGEPIEPGERLYSDAGVA